MFFGTRSLGGGRINQEVFHVIVLVFGLWGIVLGGFTETILSLFWNNNAVYVFGVCYQLTSTMLATMAFLILSFCKPKLY